MKEDIGVDREVLAQRTCEGLVACNGPHTRESRHLRLSWRKESERYETCKEHTR